MSSNYLTADNGVSSGVTGITQSAGNDGTLQIRTTTSGGTATTAVTIDNTQKVTFANSIGFGSNAGITFNNSSALTNSTLNDYETGTWTPADASGAGLTFTGVTAKYTKIGNIVTVQSQLTYPTTASGSTAAISGLPFTTAIASSGSVKNNNGLTILPLVANSSTTINFNIYATGGNATNVQMTGVTIIFTITYTTTF